MIQLYILCTEHAPNLGLQSLVGDYQQSENVTIVSLLSRNPIREYLSFPCFSGSVRRLLLGESFSLATCIAGISLCPGDTESDVDMVRDFMLLKIWTMPIKVYPPGNDHISHQTGKGKSSTQTSRFWVDLPGQEFQILWATGGKKDRFALQFPGLTIFF